MGKLHIIFILISALMLMTNAGRLFHRREKIAKFRVYVQDVLGGPNATVYEVARANITSTSPTTSFGLVRVGDDLITVGPNANSKQLGRLQGLIINSGLEEPAITTTGNFVFTAGKYKGSTLCIVGWKLISNINQEYPIVGGTGVFRWARGYTISNTYSYDAATNYFILIYDIYVVYMEYESGFRFLAKE